MQPSLPVLCVHGSTPLILRPRCHPILELVPRRSRPRSQRVFYPLHARVCESVLAGADSRVRTAGVIFNAKLRLLLVVLRIVADGTPSDSAAEMIAARGLGPRSQVVEIASNDGYLLQYFKQATESRSSGVEPSDNCAEVARMRKAFRTSARFFGRDAATTW